MAFATKLPARTRLHLLPLLIWSAFCLLFFTAVFTAAQRFPDGDFSGQFYAFANFQARELYNGRFPLYSPGSYGGYPFIGDSQSAAFYPVRWLTIALGQPVNFPYYLLQLEAIFHIWLTGIFTYLLAFDSTHRCRAAAIAAVAFGLSGYLVGYPLVQLGILEAMAWLPLALFALRRAIWGQNGRSPIRWLLIAALALIMSGFVGHMQTFFQISLLAAAYYVYLARQARWRWRWTIALGAGLALIVVGALAVALLPALRYVADSNRSAVSYEFVSSGFPLQDYLQLFLPATLTYWSPQYSGIAALPLAALGWYGRRLTDKNEVQFWGAMIVLAGALSLGDNGIIFQLFHRTVPGFALFRQQERWVFLVVFGLTLLAAQGTAVYLNHPRAVVRAALAKAAAFVAGGIALAALLLAFISQEPWLAALARQTVIGGGAMALLWIGKSGKKWRITAVTLLLFLDLYLAVHSSIHLQDGSPSVYWPELDWVAALQAEPLARFDSQMQFIVNLGEAYELEDIQGISPIKPNRMAEFQELPRPVRWQLLNVAHIIAAAPLAEGMTAVMPVQHSPLPDQTANATLYRYENALPRAWMVYETIAAATPEEALDALRDPAFQPAAQAVVETPPLHAIAPPPQPPRVESHRPAPGRLRIETESATNGLLVISEWDYPGWRATVDGRSADLQTVNYALLGLPLTAGNHVVELAYRPADLSIGAALTAVALLLAALIGWRWRPIVPIRQAASGKRRLARNAWQAVSGKRQAATGAWQVGTVTAVILLSYGLRLYQLEEQELRGGETLLGLQSSPLGNSEFTLRYPLLLLGVLLVPLLYRAGRRLALPYLPLAAAWLAAISPALAQWSQEGAMPLPQEKYPELARHLTAVGVELIGGSASGWAEVRWLWLATLAIVLYGRYFLLKNRLRWAIGLSVALGVPTLLSFLLRYRGEDGAVYNLMIAALPPFILLLSVGLAALAASGGWRRGTAAALLGALTAVSFLSLYRLHVDPLYAHRPGYRELTAWLEEEAAVGDLLLTSAPDPALDYYIADLDIPRAVGSADGYDYNRLWLLSPPDGDAALIAELDAEMVLVAKRPFIGFTLRGYQPMEKAEMLPVNGRLPAEQINLEAAFMTVNGVAAPFEDMLTLPANAEVEVTLVWSAETAVGGHYAAFVHLLAPDGFLLAQHDGIPHDGLRPTASWAVGEQIIDKHRFIVPAETMGTLVVGLYDAESVERVLFANGRDALPLAP